ncbi:hypothetical protein ACJMK2_023874 [Sinanodonta woodiana]|uniref:Uncharacterized protein n=1 Tax=Sinanodonta woodiana TaxID=1069815 RepID=A0ABD3T5L2_SINWO
MASDTVNSARMVGANLFEMGATDIPPNDLKMLVIDETFQCLKAVLLVSGQGRRPNLPQVEYTNKLLLQLHFLCEDGGRSGKELHLWVKKLFPTLVFPSQRITRHIDRLLLKFQAMSSSDLPAFLSSKVNLDFISEALSERGVFRNFDDAAYIKGVVSNQIVLDLESFRIHECLKTDFVCKMLRSLSSQILDCDDKQLTKCVCTVFKLYKNILKQKSRKPDQYISFLSCPFSLHNTITKVPPSYIIYEHT